jgi:outer membrane protein insertion porin family
MYRTKLKHIFRALGLMAFFLLLVLPQDLIAADYIAAVDVRGNEVVSTETIKAVITSRPGKKFNAKILQNDLKALYSLGQFQDIRVFKERHDAGIVLILEFVEKPRIVSIDYQGNEAISDEDLSEEVSVEVFDVADFAEISLSIDRIKQLYASKGFHLVMIAYRFEEIPNSHDKKLIFSIEEKDGIRVKKLNFVGNKVFSDKELKKVVQTKEKGFFSWISGSGKYHRELLERDTAFLTFHYLNHGYLNINVDPPEVFLTPDREWLYINFTVEEGKQFRIGTVSIEGDILTTREELLKIIETKEGNVYSRKIVEEDIQRLAELYGNQSYAFASINPQTNPNNEALTADIIFYVDKGQKIKIEEINISGNTVTRDKVIRRELEVVENSFYSESRIRRSREKLMALGYFEEVNFSMPRGSSDDQVVLNVKVKEKSTGTFSIGAGFSSVENFLLTASLSKENFLGRGVRGSFSLELSSLRQLFLLSYEDPYFLDSTWILGVSGFRTVNAFEDFNRESFGGGLTLGKRLFDRSRVHLGYSIEDVKANNFSTIIPEPFAANLSGLTSSMSLTVSRDTRNNRLYPTGGTYASVNQEFAGVGGDNKFYRVTGNGRFYQPLFWKIIFKQNATMSYIKSLDSNPVPLIERFFTGGINSLRGYQFRSVGPSIRVANDAEGGDSNFVIGGNRLLLFNTELEIPLSTAAGLNFVAFYDAGNVFSEEENFNPFDLRHNYGFGMRWNSPFGPMRFEWGIPINKRKGDDAVVFNFTIGSFF